MGKELQVNPFNKEDIKSIAKEVVEKQRPLSLAGIPAADKIFDFADAELHTLTPEIEEYIYECYKKGYIRAYQGLLFLNYVSMDDAGAKIQNICFGCQVSGVSASHENVGAHLEIGIKNDTNQYVVYYYET